MPLPFEFIRKHSWITNRGLGGEPVFVQDPFGLVAYTTPVKCGRCGVRAWITHDDWKRLIMKRATEEIYEYA